jgi:hypothetical protein
MAEGAAGWRPRPRPSRPTAYQGGPRLVDRVRREEQKQRRYRESCGRGEEEARERGVPGREGEVSPNKPPEVSPNKPPEVSPNKPPKPTPRNHWLSLFSRPTQHST